MLKYRRILIAGGVVVAAMSAVTAQSASSSKVEQTTPAGITLQEPKGPDRRPAAAERRTPGIFNGQIRRGGRVPGTEIAYWYADAKGKTLYTYAQDVAGKSNCVADCAKAQPPALVPAGAKAAGAWSTIKRDDGISQWAYQGKPLYTSTKDEDVGENRGSGGGFIALRLEQDSLVNRPFGVQIDEVRTVSGYALTNEANLAVYAYAGKGEFVQKDCTTSVCAKRWTPLMAAAIAHPVGDFTLIDRADGYQQWAYQGKPLYTFSGDVVKGDAFGVGVSTDFELAVVARNFQAPGTGMYFDPARGAIVSTDKGMTLYRVDFSYHSPDGHGLPGSFNGSPPVGRAMGTAPCVDECLKTWRPLQASAKDLPSGHWSIMERSNGTRQWAYKGFATYTYAGDKKPGERSGSDIYDIMIVNDPTVDVYQDNNEYKPDEEMKYGRRVLRARDAAANYWAYIDP